VRISKSAPDLFLHVALKMHVDRGTCIVVKHSPVGVAAGVAAGLMVIGFAGGSHASGQLDRNLRLTVAHSVITDMRALQSAGI